MLPVFCVRALIRFGFMHKHVVQCGVSIERRKTCSCCAYTCSQLHGVHIMFMIRGFTIKTPSSEASPHSSGLCSGGPFHRQPADCSMQRHHDIHENRAAATATDKKRACVRRNRGRGRVRVHANRIFRLNNAN